MPCRLTASHLFGHREIPKPAVEPRPKRDQIVGRNVDLDPRIGSAHTSRRPVGVELVDFDADAPLDESCGRGGRILEAKSCSMNVRGHRVTRRGLL